MSTPLAQREAEFKLRDGFRDPTGQAHFPPSKLQAGMLERVKLGRVGGYYPKMGGKK